MTAEPFQLFDSLPSHIEDALRLSIQRFGVLVPVTVDQDGNVLDGNHRKRIAEELKVPYDRLVRHCDDDAERREIARTLNADRRQLTEQQRRAVTAELREQGHSVRAIAGALGVGKTTVADDIAELSGAGQLTQPDRVTGIDGKTRPARRPTVFARNSREQERAQDALALIADVSPARTLDVKRAERIARENAAHERRSRPVDERSAPGKPDIRHGDFREVLADIHPGSVDVVFTDPPYPAEYLPLWTDLAKYAARWLKPGGLLVSYTGHHHLPDVMCRLGEHLRYVWIGALILRGPNTQSYAYRIRAWHKPLLWYANGAYRPWGGWVPDTVYSPAPEKTGHDWQQSLQPAVELLDKLTLPGELVVDPFLGAGTTATACRDLGRRFIGCDTDAAAVATARERVA